MKGSWKICVLALFAQPLAAQTPISDMGTATYQGYQGGLYPGGLNDPPAAHRMSVPEQELSVTLTNMLHGISLPAQPVVAPAGTSYVVVQAPPAPQPEAVPERPSTRHVWIPGYWTWQNSRYAWMAGHWEVPPFTGAVWVAPRYHGRNYYRGHWR